MDPMTINVFESRLLLEFTWCLVGSSESHQDPFAGWPIGNCKLSCNINMVRRHNLPQDEHFEDSFDLQ